MKRVELFAVVHKAVRLQSVRALSELATCSGDLEATARALRTTRELLTMLEVHARVEDRFVVTAIEARRPGAAARFVEAHEDHAAAIAMLRTRIGELERDPRAVHPLYLEVTRLVADVFLHMYEEEMLAAPLLDEIYTQSELAVIATRSRESVTPAEQALFAPLMLASLDHRERAA